MIKKVTILFVTWRIFLFFIASLGDKFIAFSPRFPYSDALLIPSKLPSFIWSFANFDGVHYITIAKSGYSAQFTQVFFPLYPILVGLLSRLVGDNFTIISGLLISNTLFLLSLIVFYKLLTLDFKPHVAWWSIYFLLTFPTSFYFGSYYSESLFFLFLLCSFYAVRKKRWLTGATIAAISSLTRLIGILLVPALLWEWYVQTDKKRKSIRNILHSPILYITPLGLVAYMIYLHLSFGDALYFWHAQPVFGAQRSGTSIILLPQVLFRYIKILTSVPLTLASFWIPLIELFSTIFAIALLFICIKKKVRTSYIIFSFFAVLIPTLSGTLSSMPRYILMAFPIYILLGSIKNVWLKSAILILMCSLLAILAILFTHGIWVA